MVAWQNKTGDDKYYERLGGGWVSADNLTNYKSQGEALTAIAPTAIPPTPSPTVDAQKVYASKPPTGNFSAQNGKVGISCNVQYINSIGYFSANADSKFIVLNVRVTNNSSKDLNVNPLYFTLITFDGYAASIDTNTFGLNNAMKATNLPANTYTDGQIAFLLTKNAVPGKLVFKSFETSLTVDIVK